MRKTPIAIAAPEALQEAMELAEELRPTLHRLIRRFRRENQNEEISPLQKWLLVAILERPEIGIGELARWEGTRGPTISGHVKTLEEKGWVKRSSLNLEDRRRTGLIVTEKGEALIEAMRRRRTDWLAHQLNQLSPQSRKAIRNAIAPLNELGQ